jgi:hypothetical protein
VAVYSYPALRDSLSADSVFWAKPKTRIRKQKSSLRRMKMKRNVFWLGMLAIALTFGMTAVGCDDGSGNGGDDGSGNTGTDPGSIAGDWLWYNPNDPNDMGAKLTFTSDGQFSWNSYSGGEYYNYMKGTYTLTENNVSFTITAVWDSNNSDWDSSSTALEQIVDNFGGSLSFSASINGTSSGSIMTMGTAVHFKKQ